TLKPGLKPSVAQLVTWNGTDRPCEDPSVLCNPPVIFIGSQLVGLNVKPGRLTVTLTCWICSGMPSMIVGILYGPVLSVVIVKAAVMGSTSIFALTTTQSQGVFFSRS